MTLRRLFCVRHGETVGQSSIRFHGSADVPLSDEGRDQIRSLIGHVEHESFRAVVHSPLSRAVESARILVEALRVPPGTVEAERDLREIHFGEIEGMTVEEIEAVMPDWLRGWRADEVEGFPGGDRIAEFQQRVGDAFERIVERHPDGDVLVVAHKGSLKAGIARLCGVPRPEIRSWDMELASLWMLEYDGQWNIARRNVR